MELFLRPTIAGPVYFLFAASILVEAYFYRVRRGKAYPWGESGVSLAIAVAHGLTGYISQAIVVAVVAGIVWNLRITTMPMHLWWAWALLVVLEELAYYWYHRSAHRIEFLWAFHRVHHSPNELTLASAYRIGITPTLSLSWLFYMPIVWIGFPPFNVFGIVALNLGYQFWLHTTLIPRLGPIEGILNTPSAHRVHHGRNAEYLDKNYGGIVMIFDRLFGTYQPEDPAIEINYGLVNPEQTLNPLWVAFGGYVQLLRQLWRARNWRDRWHLLIRPPGWSPTAAVET